MSLAPLLDAGPVALALAIRARQVSCAEVVGAYLARIADRDPGLGSFVEVYAAAAVRDARKKDLTPGGPAFHGVPIAIKDLNLVRFRRARFGSNAMPAFWSPVDDRTVSALRAAGFIVLGKTATTELGAMPVTEPAGRAPTRNPWDPTRTPGGSSGGSAAAVAAGLVPVAHGSDGGGSLRIPAAFCGLVGFKASRGHIPNAFGRDDPTLLYTCGALVRTVSDAAAMYAVLATPSRPAPRAGDRKPRVRVVLRTPLVTAEGPIAAVTRAVADRLADAGYDVTEDAAPAGELDAFLPIWQKLVSSVPLVRWSQTQGVTRWLAESGRAWSPARIAARQAELDEQWTRWAGDDLILTPTVGVPPPAVGAFDHEGGEDTFRAAAVLGAFTAPFNVTGQPAISVPAGLHPTLGVPIGVQLALPKGHDGALLRIAAEVEAGARFAAHPQPQLPTQQPA